MIGTRVESNNNNNSIKLFSGPPAESALKNNTAQNRSVLCSSRECSFVRAMPKNATFCSPGTLPAGTPLEDPSPLGETNANFFLGALLFYVVL